MSAIILGFTGETDKSFRSVLLSLKNRSRSPMIQFAADFGWPLSFVVSSKKSASARVVARTPAS
jgi:hypothetical protein